MPETSELIEALRSEGHPAVVSGAGPSVLVLEDDPVKRLRAVEITEQKFPQWRALTLAVDVKGASVNVQSGSGS